MKAKVLIIVPALLALVGCSSEEEDAVRRLMIDPDAAQFRDVSRCQDNESILRGKANGKNRLGAYTGYRSFYSDGRSIAFEGDGEFINLLASCYGVAGAATPARSE